MKIIPIARRQAADFIRQHHRHHTPPQGFKYALGLVDVEGYMRGVITVGRPVSRHLDCGLTAEVTRLATDGTSNACSMLYGAARRVAREMGYRRIITYILSSETGTSLKASGWKHVGPAGGKSWSRTGRLRDDKHPLETKMLWESAL